jgi:uncharacterized membrane protein YhaH (DUF805 family)
LSAADVFLSFEGRLERERWLGAVALLVALMLAGHFALGELASRGVILPASAESARLFLRASLLAPWIALDWKRFHDRGRTGALALICPGLFVTSQAIDHPALAGAMRDAVAVLLSWSQLLVALWLVYALAYARGDAGDNRFGPPPRRPGPSETPS